MSIEATCKRILQLDAEATPGPWEVNPHPLVSSSMMMYATDSISHYQVTNDIFEPGDAALIEEYRTAAPELARECQRLVERVVELSDIVEELYPLIASHYYVDELRARVNAALPDPSGEGGRG